MTQPAAKRFPAIQRTSTDTTTTTVTTTTTTTAQSGQLTWAQPDMAGVNATRKKANTQIGLTRSKSQSAVDKPVQKSDQQASAAAQAGGYGDATFRAIDAINSDIRGAFANPFDDESGEEEPHEVELQLSHQRPDNSSMRRQSIDSAQAKRIQAAMDGIDKAARVEKKSTGDTLREGAKKLKRGMTKTVKKVGVASGLVANEQTMKLRRLLPPEIDQALKTDSEIQQVFRELGTPGLEGGDHLRKLLKGNAPTESGISDPKTYLKGYGLGRDATVNRKREWLLASDLLKRIECLEGGPEIVRKVDPKGLSSLTLAQVGELAKVLPRQDERAQMENFLDGVMRGFSFMETPREIDGNN